MLSPGFGRGNAWVLSSTLERLIPRYDLEGAARGGELVRLEAAVRRSQDELEALKARLVTEVEHAETGVLDAHLAMLEDPVFLANVRGRIQQDGVNAEQAVSDEIDVMAALFTRLQNDYLRERVHDLRDVGQRLVDALVGPGTEESVIDNPPNSVLVAHELLPSQTASIDRTRVVGIVTESGGPSSHAAILARSLGVPFVSGIPGVVQTIPHHASVLVDGDKGEVVVQPSATESRSFNRRKIEYDR
ncbi:MAG: hypothetical protein GWO24_37430, partial [Akkermansiaceae bacterium]|nr:hypothetical protein [Akkermansiaceae bacterium]